MEIRFISGINGDGVEVTIGENKFSYTYGINASYNRDIALMSKRDNENAVKHGWNVYYHQVKPFIGDILLDLVDKYDVDSDDIIYSGYYAFPDREMTEEEIDRMVNLLTLEV